MVSCFHLTPNTSLPLHRWATVGEVADWQAAQLASALQADPSSPFTVQNAPHRILAASEQGWQASQNSDQERATLLCKAWAHGDAVPNLAWISFMSFQEAGGDDFGLVTADPTLSDSPGNVLYQAYLSTAPAAWDYGQTITVAQLLSWDVQLRNQRRTAPDQYFGDDFPLPESQTD